MPGFPDRPDLDQLRRQARELLRAAARGEPAALARIRAVSERTTLSAAQLALAREYGCRNWAALRAEVERRRSPLDRWSFGGGTAIETLSGVLLPEGLVAGADDAVLFTSLTPRDNGGWLDREALAEGLRGGGDELGALEAVTETGDIRVVDDRGTIYALRLREASSAPGPSPASIRFRVDPVPAHGIEWLDLGGQNGTTARLLPSPRAVVRLGERTAVTATGTPAERELSRRALSVIAIRLDVTVTEPLDHPIRRQCDILLARAAEARRTGELDAASDLPDQLERLCAALAGRQRPDDGLPPGWAAMLHAAERTDGARLHLDLGITLPPVDGITLRLDSLISAPGGWSLFLRATPRWWRYRDDRRRKWSPVDIGAEDDRGCPYLHTFNGSSGRDGHEELSLRFRPRLDPLARRLRLTCAGAGEQIAVDLDLAPNALGAVAPRSHPADVLPHVEDRLSGVDLRRKLVPGGLRQVNRYHLVHRQRLVEAEDNH